MEYSPNKPKPKKLQKNKSFISRLSSVLVRNQLKLNNGQQCEDSQTTLNTEVPKRDSVNTNKSSKTFEYDDSIDCTTEYATICDIIQADRSDDDESPPVPPKNLNELYAKVNKKKVHTSIGCNTDPLTSPVPRFKEIEDKFCKHSVIDAKLNEKVPSPSKIQSPTQVKELRKKHVTNKSKSDKKKKSNILKTVIHHHQEELKSLKEEMEKVTNRNEDLQVHIKMLLEQEKKWKEDMSTTILSQRDHMSIMEKNSELNEKITRLELETRQEVQMLCNNVLTIRKERNQLCEEVQALKKENELNLTKYNHLKEERKGLIAVQTHLSEIKNYQSSQKEMLAKHEEELKVWQEKCRKYDNEKNSSRIEIQLLKEGMKHLEDEVLNLTNQKQELLQRNEEQSKHLGELTQKERENYELILSMTRTIKDLTSERDNLLKKSGFQDAKQKELQSAYIQQTRGFVHLEEHIMNSKKHMDSELYKASLRVQQAEANYTKMKISYEEQLEALKNKILEQTCIINSLSEDKKNLQQDFKNAWTAVLQSKCDPEIDIIKKELTEIKDFDEVCKQF